MATVQDSGAQSKPPVWKIVLNIIYSALGALKAAGKFSKDQGPKL